MKINPIRSQEKTIRNNVTFKKTIYKDKKIIEKDIFSLYGTRDLFSNPNNPKQEILGVRIDRDTMNTAKIL